MDTRILMHVHGSVKAVISQIRLPLVALIGTFILGHRQTALQWTLIMGVTVSVMGYSVVSVKGTERISTIGIWLIVFQSSCAAIGTTVSEFTLKRMKFPFCVQMSQARFINCLVSLIGLLYYCSRNEFSSLFVGWSYRIVLLVCWLAFRDWVTTFVLKSLSALWKSLSSGLALCLSYIIQTITYGKQLDLVLVAFMLCLVVDILGFALTKRQPRPADDEKTGK